LLEYTALQQIFEALVVQQSVKHQDRPDHFLDMAGAIERQGKPAFFSLGLRIST
jgi:hypothetical protein